MLFEINSFAKLVERLRNPSTGLSSPWLIRRGLPRVGGDERGVLDDALLDLEALRVELALQLFPYQPVPAGFG
jgi:hypothetical protein